MLTPPEALGYAGVLVREHRRLTELHDGELRDALAPLVDLLAVHIDSDDPETRRPHDVRGAARRHPRRRRRPRRRPARARALPAALLHPGSRSADDRDLPSRTGTARSQLHDHLGRRSPHRARALLRGPASRRAAGTRAARSSRSTTAARRGSTRTTSTRRSGSTRSRAGPRRSGAWSPRASTRCAAVVTTSKPAWPTWIVDGVFATLCFPSLIAGFAGTIFAKSKDPELGLAALRGVERLAHRGVGGPASRPRHPVAARVGQRSRDRGRRRAPQRRARASRRSASRRIRSTCSSVCRR